MALTPVTKKRFRNFLIIPTVSITGLIFVTWLATPVATRYYVKQYFKDQGETAQLDHLTIDFFPPKVHIKDFTIKKDNHTTLALKELTLGIQLSPLFTRTIHISHANIDGLQLDVEQHKNDWIIAGINLAQYKTTTKDEKKEPSKEEKTKEPWAVTLPSLRFTNSQIHITRQANDKTPTQKDTVAINDLLIDQLSGKGLDWQGRLSLKTAINAANIQLASAFHYTPNDANATLSIENTVLPLQAFKHFIPAPYNAGTGTLTLDATLKGGMKNESGKPSYTLSDTSTTAQLATINLPLGQQKTVSVKDSKLSLSNIAASYDAQQHLNAKGKIELNAEGIKTHLDKKQQASLANISFNTPIEVTQQDKALSAHLPDATLALNDLNVALSSLALTNKKTTLSLNNVNVSNAADNTLKISGKSKLNSEGVNAEQADIKTHYDTLTLANNTSFSQSAQGNLQANNTDINLELSGFTARQMGKADIDLGNATFSGDALNLTMAPKQDPKVHAKKLNLETKRFDAKLSDSKRAASWDSASIANVDLNQQGKRFDIDMGQLDIKQLMISKPLKKAQPLPALATIGSVIVKQVKANQDGAHIKSIDTNDVRGNLLLDSQKRIKNLVFVDTDKQKAPSSKAQPIKAPKQQDIQTKQTDKSDQHTADSSFKAPYYIILDAYNMTGTSSLYIQDNSIDPTLNRTLTIEKFALRNLNTKDKKQKATLDFKARNDKYSTISGKVGMYPLANKLTLTSDLIVSQAELPPYSPYIANVLGYQIDSGQLNLDLKLVSKAGKLSGTTHIVLKQFDLGGAHQSSSVIKAGVVPLNIAVSALKDGDGNIDLDIPLSGNIESPQFGWGDFLFLPIKKALFKASSSYLLQTFVPYANVISVAQFAGEQLLKIRVEPLIFKPEQTDLSDDQDTFLKQLTELMKDKKGSELKACGVASYQDLGLKKPPVNIDNSMRQEANAIATKRAQSLKDYLVDKKIDSSRIFICAPSVDLQRNSKPRIKLTF